MKRNLSLTLFVLLFMVASLGTASAAGKKTALLLPIVPGDSVDIEATERMDEKLGEAFKSSTDLKISTMADFEEASGKAAARKLLRCGTDLECIDKLVARSPFDLIIVAKAEKAGEKELDVRFTIYNVVEGNKKQVSQTCSSEKFGDKRAQVWSEEVLDKAMSLVGGASKAKETEEVKAPKESPKEKKAREAREKAEALKAIEETKRAAAEEKKRQAEEAKRALEEKKAREEEAKKEAAEKRAKAEAERKAAEEKKQKEAAVKVAEDAATAADAEVTRLEKALAEAKRTAEDKHQKAKEAKRAAGLTVFDEEKAEKPSKSLKEKANLDDEDDAALWKSSKAKKDEKPAKADKAEKVEKVEKADKKAEKADKKADKADKNEKAEKADKAKEKRNARAEEDEEDDTPPPPKVKKPVLPTKEEVQENVKKAYMSFVGGDLDTSVTQINAAVEKRCGCDADGDAYTLKAMLESFSGIWKKIDAAQKSQDSKNIIANLDEMKTLERELAKTGKKIGVDKESKFAKEMNSSFAKGYLSQARGQIKAFNFLAARDSLKKALELNPKESEAQAELDKMPEYAKRLLSQAQSETDYDPDGAIRKLKQVIELVGADSATGKLAQKKLKELEE